MRKDLTIRSEDGEWEAYYGPELILTSDSLELKKNRKYPKG